jgi:hypothetical protein
MMAPTAPPMMMLPNMPELAREMARALASGLSGWLQTMSRSLAERRTSTVPPDFTLTLSRSLVILQSAPATVSPWAVSVWTLMDWVASFITVAQPVAARQAAISRIR